MLKYIQLNITCFCAVFVALRTDARRVSCRVKRERAQQLRREPFRKDRTQQQRLQTAKKFARFPARVACVGFITKISTLNSPNDKTY